MDDRSNKVSGLGLPSASSSAGLDSATQDNSNNNHHAQGAATPSVHIDHVQAQHLDTGHIPADDGSDVLDQEWVSKAKDIVERTKSNPFLESKELSKVKAEYLKTRFNKHIKVDEGHTEA